MSEHDEQVALFIWAAMYEERFPQLKMLFAVPNGGYRMAKTARDLKAEGVKKGVPDVFYPVPRKKGNQGFVGLVIEMKFDKNKPTREQEWWLGMLKLNAWKTVVCYSWQEAAKAIAEYEGIQLQFLGLSIED